MYNKYFKIIIIILLFIILFYIINNILIKSKKELFNNFTFNQEEFEKKINNFKYYDENNNLIDNKKEEIDEQRQAFTYLEPTDIILELGARYGTVSVMAASIVKDKGKLVSVEPDNIVLNALKKNKKINNVEFEIVNKIISNKNKKIIHQGYATHSIDSDENNNNTLTYDEFKNMYPYKFNVLIIDCEACFCDFFEIMGDDIKNYNKIILEADNPNPSYNCDYNNIIKSLTEKYNFKIIENNNNFRYYLYRE